jgi:hypothetical protein
MRLRGQLDVDALRESFSAVVRRHESLRTRIVVYDGAPAQEVDEIVDWKPPVDDLSAFPEDRRAAEALSRIEAVILEPVDVAVGPLFAARILRLQEDEHILIVATEHVISDAYSMAVLLEDLFTAYVQISQGRSPSWPKSPLQFADYAIRQQSTQQAWIARHGPYWDERLAGCGRMRFPASFESPVPSRVGWATVPLHISANLRTELCEWSRARRTSLPMSVFTAYAALVMRWCNTRDAVIRYQSHGRGAPGAQGAIGFFASRLYLRIAVPENDSFADLLKRITAEYCKACEHDDLSYLEAQPCPPEASWNTFFNWIPQTSVKVHAGIVAEPVTFINPWLRELEWDNEPMIFFYEAGNEITGELRFPLDRFSADTMERFSRSFLEVLTQMLTQS